MAPDHVALLRETCARWSQGDFKKTLAFVHPDAVWEPSGKFIGSGDTYHGPAGVRRFWSLFREPWEEITLEPVQFTAIGPDRVLTRTRFRGTGRVSGAVTETELWVVWTISDGKVAPYQSFPGYEAAMDALGARDHTTT